MHEEFFYPEKVIIEKGDAIDQLYFVCDGELVRIQYLIITLHIFQKKRKLLLKISINVNSIIQCYVVDSSDLGTFCSVSDTNWLGVKT